MWIISVLRFINQLMMLIGVLNTPKNIDYIQGRI